MCTPVTKAYQGFALYNASHIQDLQHCVKKCLGVRLSIPVDGKPERLMQRRKCF